MTDSLDPKHEQSGRFGDPFEFDASVEHVNTPLWREAMWPAEWIKLRTSPIYHGRGVPHGNGEPVLLIPGFLSNDMSLAEMRRWLRRIGYRTYASRISWNVDCPDATAERLLSRIHNIRKRSGQRVRIVGHSLGGMLARSLVQRDPEAIDRVITLGSPFRDLVRAHPAVVGIWDHLKMHKSGVIGRNLKASCATGHCLCTFVKNMLDPDDRQVPQFAVYSRKDGVAHWESCINDDPASNFEVDSTHIGMAVHPRVYQIVAERLQDTA